MTLLIHARVSSAVRSDKEMRERFYGTTMMNSSAPASNDGTIAKMFDRVLEKEFSENDQPEGQFFFSFSLLFQLTLCNFEASALELKSEVKFRYD